MAKPVFGLKGISFSYSENNQVLRNIDLNIFPSQIVALLGANGSGKSTLLKLLNGLIFAQAGTFKTFGQLISEEVLEKGEFATFFRKKTAFVFQDSDVCLFSATVYEDLIFGPLQLGLSKEEASLRADDLLKMFSIEKLKNCSPNKLSGGEKKKVAIAASLSTNPDILLLDEPTNNLDPKTKIWLYGVLDDLAKSGKTVIFATQDLRLAKIIAKRAIVLSEEHEIAADGPIEDILSNNELLLSVNLIHEHFHYHDDIAHIHPHQHANEHDHNHLAI